MNCQDSDSIFLSLGCFQGGMYRVGGLQLDPNLGVRLGKKSYFCLMIEKIYTFAAFTKKYLWPYRCSGTYFTATVNFADPKIELQNQINEIEIIEIQI